MPILRPALASLALLLCLAACSKVTAENYSHIETGSSRADVVKLLGEPDKTDAGSVLGISGETAIWQSGQATISLRMVNGLVITKDFKQH